MRTRSLFPFVLVVALLALSVLFLAGLATAPSPTLAESAAWTDLQGPRGGSAEALAINPNYPVDLTVLAGGGTDTGRGSWLGLGLFRSTDGGLTWPDRIGAPTAAALDVAFSPDWQNDGFAAAALYPGVWTTADHGATWQTRLGSADQIHWLSAIAIGPAAGSAPHTLLAAGPYGGLFRSPDSGATWVYQSAPGQVRAFSYHPTQPGLVLAASGGIWRSTDDGLTWSRVLSGTYGIDVDFAAAGSATGAATGSASGAAAYATVDDHVWRSVDNGLTWQALDGPAVNHFGPLGVSADGAAIFTAAGATLYRYDVAAAAFVTVTTDLHPNAISRIAPSPTFGVDHTVLAGTPDGVFRSTDGGATFTRSQGFVPLTVNAIDGPPGALASGDLFTAGDFGVWKRSGDRWLPASKGLSSQSSRGFGSLRVSPAYAADGTLFVSSSEMNTVGSALHKSTDRGAAWHSILSSSALGAVVLSPNYGADQTILVIDAGQVKRSTNGGATWAVTLFWDGFYHFATRLAVSPAFATDHAIYAVGNDIYYSHDGGTTWQVSTGGPPLNSNVPDRWYAGHLVPGPSGAVYLAVGRSDATPPYAAHTQLWTSSDRGVTWQQLAGTPDLPILSLAAGPTPGGAGDTLYTIVSTANPSSEPEVATDLLVSPNGGHTWQNLGATPREGGRLNPVAGAPGSLYYASVGAWLFSTAGALPTATPDPCTELLLDRNFDQDGTWRIPQTAYPAARVYGQYQSPYSSMRTGILEATANLRSYSDFSQDVKLPVGKTITLRINRWPTNGAVTQADATGVPDAAAQLASLDNVATVDEFYRQLEAAAGDSQYGLLIAPPGGKLKYLFTGLRDDRAWIEQSFDLSAYAGQTVRLQFGTYNDGAGPVAAQYFDSFKLLACGKAAPTPAPGATPRLWLPSIRRPNATYPPNQW